MGRGWVVLEVCAGCGKPAFDVSRVVAFCGDEKCWPKVVNVVVPTKEEEPRSVEFRPVNGFGSAMLPAIYRARTQAQYFHGEGENDEESAMRDFPAYST